MIGIEKDTLGILDHISNGVMIISHDYTVEYWNRVMESWTGILRDEIVGHNLKDLYPHLLKPPYLSRLDSVLDGGAPIIFSAQLHQFIIPAKMSDGQMRIQHTVVHPILKTNQGCSALFDIKDVTDLTNQLRDYAQANRRAESELAKRVIAEKALEHMATHDVLTGLPNRRLFNDRIALELARAERNRSKLGLMLFDMDNFKEINDTYGHNVGDQILQIVGKRISNLLRKSDTIARIGGDEFVIILPEQNTMEGTFDIIKRIEEAFQSPIKVEKFDIRVGASIGISLYPEDSQDADGLIKEADTAMYRAKKNKNGMVNAIFRDIFINNMEISSEKVPHCSLS